MMSIYHVMNINTPKTKLMRICLLWLCLLALSGCEVTFKTRDFHNSKSSVKQKISQRSKTSKMLNQPTSKNTSIIKSSQVKESHVGAKILSLFGLKQGVAEKNIPKSNRKETTLSSSTWAWPVKSTKDNHISLKKAPAGMLFLGKPLTSVVASAKGVVTYSGSGLQDYGNLIIIKHANEILSVYANNKRLIVKEGDIVSQGQEIAKIGDQGKMLFEIRQNGKSLDPLKFLPNKIQ